MGGSSIWYNGVGNAANNDGGTIITVENFEILNASGTLYLVNK